MTARDLFGLVVRIVGLLVSLYGIYSLIFAAIEATGFATKAAHPSGDHAIFGLAIAAWGWAIVFFAERITRFAYPDTPRRDE